MCVVVDGRKNFNPRTRAMLAALGCYQEGVAKNLVNGQPVVSHVVLLTILAALVAQRLSTACSKPTSTNIRLSSASTAGIRSNPAEQARNGLRFK